MSNRPLHLGLALSWAALAACNPPIDLLDTGEEPPEPLDLAVGGIAEMERVEGVVQAELVQPGTYLVILVSTAEDQGTLFGYGEQAPAARVVDPADPLPIRSAPVGLPLVPEVGDTRTFRVWNGSATVTIEAEAVRVTDQVVVWEDQTTANPIGSIDGETIDGVLTGYQDIVLPRTRQIFGTESDVDEDGRIAVLISYTVNQYGAQAYVSPCDIGVGDCGGWGNDAEVIYLGVPDPDDSRASVNAITETVAHEHNHLVYSWHKYALNDQPEASENIYVTEGFSALAQDLCGYNNGNQYVWAAAIDMRDFYDDEDFSIQGVSANDILRGDTYYDEDRDGPLRGAAYLLLRYLFEQAGGMHVTPDGTLVDDGGMDWVQAWLHTPDLGVDAVETTTSAALWPTVMDWYTALVLTGRGLTEDARYTYQSREEDPLTGYSFGVDPSANIHGWLQLEGPPVQPWKTADGWLRAGGVEYLEVASEGGWMSLPVDPEAEAEARLVRLE